MSERPDTDGETKTDGAPPWPDGEEEKLVKQLLAEFGQEGYGFCFLLGSYRAQGMSREAAMALVYDEAQRRGVRRTRGEKGRTHERERDQGQGLGF